MSEIEEVEVEKPVTAPYTIPRDQHLSREALTLIYGPPDDMGHITRYSDSSLYDEVCVLCGRTDYCGLDRPCGESRGEARQALIRRVRDAMSAAPIGQEIDAAIGLLESEGWAPR